MRRFAFAFLEEHGTLDRDPADNTGQAAEPFPIAAPESPHRPVVAVPRAPLDFPPNIPGTDIAVTRLETDGLFPSDSELNWMSGVPA
jgi:hypothetical protein